MIVSLRTKPSSLYRHGRGLRFTWSRLQRRKYNIRIAKLVFHAKESPIWTRDEVLSLVSSRSNSPAKVYSPAVHISPNPGLPHPCGSVWPNSTSTKSQLLGNPQRPIWNIFSIATSFCSPAWRKYALEAIIKLLFYIALFMINVYYSC